MKYSVACLLFAVACSWTPAVWSSQPRLAIFEIENVSQPERFPTLEPGETRRPNFTPTLFPILTVFHDGSIDLFDMGRSVSTELGWLASEGHVVPLIEALRAEHPDAVINMVTNSFMGAGVFGDLTPTARSQNLDPERHRYFSYVAKVGPSDDAFVGNEDPRQHEVFNENGVYQGPLVVKVHGGDVLDAGVKANDEQDLMYFDERLLDTGAGEGENEHVRPHPGFNGSLGNPDGVPVGILGVPSYVCTDQPTALSCFHLDSVEGDFTQPGHVLALLRVSVGLDGSFGGFWYDPARSGEGFNVSIFEGNPQSMAVAWYTYDPQGNPLYLTGVGDVQHQFAEIEMVSTSSGAMASTDNPANVVREPWGTIRLGFGLCNEGRVFYEPLSDEYPIGDYFITRATPRSVGAKDDCGPESLELNGVADNIWMTPTGLQFVEPDPGPSE